MDIYVDKLPKSCKDCPCRHKNALHYCCACDKPTLISDCTFDMERLNTCPLKLIQDHDKDKYQQIQALQEQLKNAIVPKFKIGQEVYMVIDKVEKAKVEKIICNVARLEDETYTLYSLTDSSGYALRLPEEQIFATQAAAEQRLRERQGDK